MKPSSGKIMSSGEYVEQNRLQNWESVDYHEAKNATCTPLWMQCFSRTGIGGDTDRVM